MEKQVTKRKHGDVAQVHVELMLFQVKQMDFFAEKFGMSRADIIAHALNMWLDSIAGK